MTVRRRSRPAWQGPGGVHAELPQGSDPTDGAVVGWQLADLWSYTGSGSRAGCGFHYQDAVGAWLAGLILTGEVQVEKLVSRRGERISRVKATSPGRFQVESCQEHLGDFSGIEAAGTFRIPG